MSVKWGLWKNQYSPSFCIHCTISVCVWNLDAAVLVILSHLILLFLHFLGFTAITTTNPIWLVKTRLQLDAR